MVKEIVQQLFNRFNSVQVSEPESINIISPQSYPYITEHGFSQCYITHLHTTRRRNGADVHYTMVQDVYDGQHHWLTDKQLFVNSWFNMYLADGVR